MSKERLPEKQKDLYYHRQTISPLEAAWIRFSVNWKPRLPENYGKLAAIIAAPFVPLALEALHAEAAEAVAPVTETCADVTVLYSAQSDYCTPQQEKRGCFTIRKNPIYETKTMCAAWDDKGNLRGCPPDGVPAWMLSEAWECNDGRTLEECGPKKTTPKPRTQTEISCSLGFHTVRNGDTMSSIARKRGVSLDELIAANQHIKNPSLIRPGDTICIPQAPSKPTQQKPTATIIPTAIPIEPLTQPQEDYPPHIQPTDPPQPNIQMPTVITSTKKPETQPIEPTSPWLAIVAGISGALGAVSIISSPPARHIASKLINRGQRKKGNGQQSLVDVPSTNPHLTHTPHSQNIPGASPAKNTTFIPTAGWTPPVRKPDIRIFLQYPLDPRAQPLPQLNLPYAVRGKNGLLKFSQPAFLGSNGVYQVNFSQYEEGQEIIVPGVRKEVPYKDPEQKLRADWERMLYLAATGQLTGTPEVWDIQHAVNPKKDPQLIYAMQFLPGGALNKEAKNKWHPKSASEIFKYSAWLCQRVIQQLEWRPLKTNDPTADTDLTASNILIDPTHGLFRIDWAGSSVGISDTEVYILNQSGEKIPIAPGERQGKPYYCAIDVYRHETLDPLRLQVVPVAAIIYELLSRLDGVEVTNEYFRLSVRDQPLQISDVDLSNDKLRRVLGINNEHLFMALRRLLLPCLNYNPKVRPTIYELQRSLKKFLYQYTDALKHEPAQRIIYIA
jgi:LysM repeat protein